MNCSHCGATTTATARYCNQCGHATGKLSQAAPTIAFQGSAPAPTSASLQPGMLLHSGRYRLICCIGSGGMGEVWSAEDTPLGRKRVAIKRLSLNGLTQRELQEQLVAFQQEARLLANLRHDQLPAVTNYFSEGQDWYLVMDYIEGVTLEDHLEVQPGNKLSDEKVIEIGLQLCDVLIYLHSQTPPIIFRDLKPGNIMIRASDDKVCLIDFGIARTFKQGQAKDTVAMGSPGYAAPEQHGRAQSDVRTDIYALGATLYAMSTGKDPSNSPFCFDLRAITNDFLRIIIEKAVQLDPQQRAPRVQAVKNGLLVGLKSTRGLVSPISARANTPAPAFHSAQPFTLLSERRNIFIYHAPADKRYADGIVSGLATVKRLFGITIQTPDTIVASSTREQALLTMAQEAFAVMVIISPNFLSDDATYERWCNTILPVCLQKQWYVVYARPTEITEDIPGMHEICRKSALPATKAASGSTKMQPISISEMNRDTAHNAIARSVQDYCKNIF